MMTKDEIRCYGCGKVWSDKAVALLAQIVAEGETPDLIDALNTENAEHEGCFQ